MVKCLRRILFAGALLLWLDAASVRADQISFRVQTPTGAPVPHAVISAGPLIDAENVDATMDQVDKKFAPYVLPVSVGTEVNFPNSDQIRHHVYSFSKAKPFELRLYSGVPDSPIVFDKAGIVVLGCNIHDNMVGYIYISDREYFARTEEDGRAVLETDGGISELSVWYPSLSIDSLREENFELADLSKEGDTYLIELDIMKPPAHPQAIKTTERDKFRRYIDR